MEAVYIVLGAGVIAALFVLVFLSQSRNKYAKQNGKYAEFRKRREAAHWAMALIVQSQASTVGEMGSTVHASLTLEVTPPGGDTYRAHTSWNVDLSALSNISVGSTVQIKIDALDPQIIYPGSTWASYMPEL